MRGNVQELFYDMVYEQVHIYFSIGKLMLLCVGIGLHFVVYFNLSLCFLNGYAGLKLGVVQGPNVLAGPCQPLIFTISNSVEVSNFSCNDKRSRQGKESSFLTRSCLSPLVRDCALGYC